MRVPSRSSGGGARNRSLFWRAKYDIIDQNQFDARCFIIARGGEVAEMDWNRVVLEKGED